MASQQRDDTTFMDLDRELENTIGLKERSIGAFNQHRKEQHS
jgi:hypothetical protein